MEYFMLDILNSICLIRYPLPTLLIFWLILTFGYPCWVATNEGFLMGYTQHFLSVRFLKNETLIGSILDIFLND